MSLLLTLCSVLSKEQGITVVALCVVYDFSLQKVPLPLLLHRLFKIWYNDMYMFFRLYTAIHIDALIKCLCMNSVYVHVQCTSIMYFCVKYLHLV